MILNLPPELLVQILSFLSLDDLILLERINKSLLMFIRNYPWNHFIVKLKDIDHIRYVVPKYQFQKYDFSHSDVTDDLILQIGQCDTLLLHDCHQLRSPLIETYNQCRILNLSQCHLDCTKRIVFDRPEVIYLIECPELAFYLSSRARIVKYPKQLTAEDALYHQ